MTPAEKVPAAMYFVNRFAMETGALNVGTLTLIAMETEAVNVGTAPAALETVAVTWVESRLPIGLTASRIVAPDAEVSALLLWGSAPPIDILSAALIVVETVAAPSAEEILSLVALSDQVAAALASQACKRNLMMCEN
mmetsp:Transcript_146619/g.273032  ORF Transcript_146619/g.273032 Transcript_146619/m.273032 type:complete len:138 (+) Transcript_146619:112-525(+)